MREKGRITDLKSVWQERHPATRRLVNHTGRVGYVQTLIIERPAGAHQLTAFVVVDPVGLWATHCVVHKTTRGWLTGRRPVWADRGDIPDERRSNERSDRSRDRRHHPVGQHAISRIDESGIAGPS